MEAAKPHNVFIRGRTITFLLTHACSFKLSAQEPVELTVREHETCVFVSVEPVEPVLPWVGSVE